MPTAKYDVQATLRLNAGGSFGVLKGLSDKASAFGAAIRGSQSAFGGLVGTIAGVAGAYVGFNAIVGALRSAVGGAVSFNAELEKTKIGLASVLSATQGVDFARGISMASGVFDQLKDDALKSTATTKELFDIYQSIVGPISGAGAGLETVREITNNTVAAASALNVDFAQASRDIMAMSSGVAGLDVKLFRMLRSTGQIREDAKAFNALSAPERIEKLRRALASFGPAADAYGKSWMGVTSTFKDIVQQLGSNATGPAFERVKRFLGSINDRLLAHRHELTAALTEAGEQFGRIVGRTLDRANRGIEYVTSHWGEITDKIREGVTRLREMMPSIIRAAKMFAAFSVARQVIGGGLQVAGAVGSATSAAGGLFSMLSGGGAAAGGAAVAAEGAAVGAGGAAAGAAGAAGGGAMAAISAALAPLGLVLVALAGIVTIVYEKFDELKEMFAFLEPTIMATWEDLKIVGASLWDIARPILKLIGTGVVAALVVGFTVLVGLLRVAVFVIARVAEAFAWFMRTLEEYVIDPLVDLIFGALNDLSAFIARIMGDTGDGEYTGPQDHRSNDDIFEDLARSMGVDQNAMGRQPGIVPVDMSERPHVTNDFRGSKIQVTQKFEQAEADRVWIRMVEGLSREADRRTQTGFSPAYSR